ncbi:D-hexose-6-phosphate mutarotase [Rosistilla oblonga]|uniref:Putative glucose-6-phosphate 1-epimerase n=1 Tax=Rosistilla oblonga TaxID=2527990 RepID=A0A518IRG7_9BACT|nr:D-hexose-6-phosphate mutarotase [Rosistilla oblonga]QDV55682.1 Putative glucose-6-phosphate 1-epimerase [Rosistilla oblonga]
MIDDLNLQFGIDKKIAFTLGNGDLPKAILLAEDATAEIYLHGAHVSSFHRHGWGEMLWMSDESNFRTDRPIRGGVPICWPWFGQPQPELPQHGFARTSQWEVIETKAHADPSLEIALRLTDSEATRQLWPHPFELTMRVIVGRDLTMQLSCLNTGEEPLDAEAALHTYFHVQDIDAVRVAGLDGRSYIDKLDAMQGKPQAGELTIDREVDRIYLETPDAVTIHDGAERRIEIQKSGSLSTVVWNPWIDKSAAMADFPNDGYRTMVCVETTNAADDVRTIQPGEVHTITQSCRCEPATGPADPAEAIL